MGDVKLALLLGAMLGAIGRRRADGRLPGGARARGGPRVRHGSKARKMAIPFAPFLAFGAIVALFAGDAILDWYLGIFRAEPRPVVRHRSTAGSRSADTSFEGISA